MGDSLLIYSLIKLIIFDNTVSSFDLTIQNKLYWLDNNLSFNYVHPFLNSSLASPKLPRAILVLDLRMVHWMFLLFKS